MEGTDWSAFSSIPTLVILMAGRRVGGVVGGECLDGIDLTSHVEYMPEVGLPVSCALSNSIQLVYIFYLACLCHMLYRIFNYQYTYSSAIRGLPKIVEKLLALGAGSTAKARWGPKMPVVVVRSAGLPQQRVWYSTLSEVVASTAGEDLSPCVVVIGEVAGLRDSWLLDGP